MASSGDSCGLSSRQRKALASLLTEPTVKDAAKAAKVGYRTLCRWMAEDNDFRNALEQAESEVIDATARRLIAGQSAALDVLENLLSEASKDSDKRLAASTWLDFAYKWIELRAVEERLRYLEDVIKNLSDYPPAARVRKDGPSND